ncbi:MAG: NAD(P)/FAD-dependent oxidoreductase [Thermoproteota archaeon]
MAASEFDVLVVGGGPAGLSAAATVEKGELRVAVIEKSKGIAETVRTSGVTWVQEIREWGLPHSFYNRIKRCEIFSPSNAWVLEMPENEACVLDVRSFYQHLAKKAASLGVEIYLGTFVNRVSYEDSRSGVRVTASSPDGTIDLFGKVVIDASGFSTVVGRSVGLAEGWERFGVGAEYEAYVENLDLETMALMVGRNYSPAGYAWIFPVAENRARIGVGIGRPESSLDPLAQLKRLLVERPGPLEKLGRVRPIEMHYGVAPSQGPREDTVADRIILVGDSAGHLNPLLLEGIRFAIRFGKMAGEVARSAIERSDASRAGLVEYENAWKREVWRDFQVGVEVQKEWLKLTDQEWDEELKAFELMPVKDVLEILRCSFQTRRLLGAVARHSELMKTRTFSIILREKTKPSIYV